jgi:hypothetical protein
LTTLRALHDGNPKTWTSKLVTKQLRSTRVLLNKTPSCCCPTTLPGFDCKLWLWDQVATLAFLQLCQKFVSAKRYTDPLCPPWNLVGSNLYR